MKILYLVFPNLSRRLLRTSLSVFTAFIAAFLLTILVSVPASISRITSDAENKLRVIVTAPNAYMLPIWYRDAIRKMPGVVAASAELQWGATYQDPREPIVAFGVDPDENSQEEDDEGSSSQLQGLFFYLELGLEEDEVVSFDDIDGETVYIRPTEVLAIEVPLVCVEPELRKAEFEGYLEDNETEKASAAPEKVVK